MHLRPATRRTKVSSIPCVLAIERLLSALLKAMLLSAPHASCPFASTCQASNLARQLSTFSQASPADSGPLVSSRFLRRKRKKRRKGQ